MKSVLFFLVVAAFLLSQGVSAQDNQMHKEIKMTIDAMIKCTQDKDFEGVMSFWEDSNDFVYIADGNEVNMESLRGMFKGYLDNLETVDVLQQSLIVHPIGKHKAYCIWKGTEKVKMIGKDAIESSWVSTLIMENKKGGWKIVHGHTSH